MRNIFLLTGGLVVVLGGLYFWLAAHTTTLPTLPEPSPYTQNEVAASSTPSTTTLSAAATTTTATVSTSQEPTPVTPAPVEPTPKPVEPPASPEPVASYKSVMTTLFWAGEAADSENAYIANDESYWDENWMSHFGGFDDPDCRDGYHPCDFTPRENPFYFALPYGEFREGSGRLKESAKQIPWYGDGSGDELLKNRWIEVKRGSKTCYGQWEDVGPFEDDDFAYVFGSADKPLNTYNEGAGLDISPALWTCLGLTDNAVTSWRFIDEGKVPAGPWKETVTSSGISW